MCEAHGSAGLLLLTGEASVATTLGIWIVDEIEAAFQLGKLLGVAPEGWAGLCPYDWTEGELRTAWLRGFSEGRVEMKARRDAGYGLFA